MQWGKGVQTWPQLGPGRTKQGQPGGRAQGSQGGQAKVVLMGLQDRLETDQLEVEVCGGPIRIEEAGSYETEPEAGGGWGQGAEKP